jgi:hypothetical protein
MSLLTKKSLKIGDIIEYRGNEVKLTLPRNATGIVINSDSRFGYGDHWNVLPDLPCWENPGPSLAGRLWCVSNDLTHKGEQVFFVIGTLPIEELLTSEIRSLQREGLRRLKQEKQRKNLLRFLTLGIFGRS